MKKQMIYCCLAFLLFCSPAAASDTASIQMRDAISAQFEAAGGYSIDQALRGRQEFDPSFSFAQSSMEFASGETPMQTTF